MNNEVMIFNPNNVKKVIKVASNIEDKIKQSAYFSLEEVAKEIIKREIEIEAHNEQLDIMNAAEIAHNEEVQERYNAKREEYNKISTSEEYALLDAITKSEVQDVRIIKRTNTDGVEEENFIYVIRNGKRDAEDLVDNKNGTRKRDRAIAMIKEIITKQEIEAQLKEEARTIQEEIKELPHTRRHLREEMQDLFELVSGMDNEVITSQLKGDYLELFNALNNEEVSTSLDRAKRLFATSEE